MMQFFVNTVDPLGSPPATGMRALFMSKSDSSGQAAAPKASLQVWWQTARPRTLPAVFGPLLLGQSLVETQQFSWTVAVLYGLWAVLLQVSVNLANDLFDGLSGVDGADRLGPARALQSGLLSAEALRQGLFACLAVAMLLGLALSIVGHWLMALFTLAALVAVLAYSGGRRPYANLGLGEVVVWVFFGPIAVLGALIAQQSPLHVSAWIAGALVGLPVAAIMLVNNLRDRVTDRRAGKLTLAVRLGPQRSQLVYAALIVLPVVLTAPFTTSVLPGWLLWSGWVALLLAGLALNHAIRHSSGVALNRLLGLTALYSLAAAIWLSIPHWGG